jgi:hypothetical protein
LGWPHLAVSIIFDNLFTAVSDDRLFTVVIDEKLDETLDAIGSAMFCRTSAATANTRRSRITTS